MMCSMQGLPTIGTIGFGWLDVSAKARALAAGHDDGLHVRPRARRRRRRRRRRARGEADPEEHVREVCVPASMSASEAHRIQVATFPAKLTESSYPRGTISLYPPISTASRARIRTSAGHGGGRAGRARSPPCRSSGGPPAGPRRSRSETRRASVVPASRRSGPWRLRLRRELRRASLWPPSAVASSTMNTGIAAKRAIVRAFGICARRSGTTRSAIPRG